MPSFNFVKSLLTLMHYLRCAIEKTTVSGISFRVYDVLYALDSLSKSHDPNFLGMECGLVDLAVQVTAEWKPGKYASMFSDDKAFTCPVLELSTDILKHLAQSEQCKTRMQNLHLESTLDRLLLTEEGNVRSHVLKVLWLIRDHARVVETASGIVAHVKTLRTVSHLYGLTPESNDKLAVQLKQEVRAHALDTQFSALTDWLQQSIFADATSVVHAKSLSGRTLEATAEVVPSQGRRARVKISAQATEPGIPRALSDVQAKLHQALASNQKLQEVLKKAESAASEMVASAVSVEQVMDNLRMITLNLDRDFDTWKQEDAKSLADTVARSLGIAKEHVKILDCQRGSVITSTVIMAPDWRAASAQLKTLLMDESGPFKDMGVVGCAGLPGGVVGKPPLPAAAAAASAAPTARVEATAKVNPSEGLESRVKICAEELGLNSVPRRLFGLGTEPDLLNPSLSRRQSLTRMHFVERFVKHWVHRDQVVHRDQAQAAALAAWKVYCKSLTSIVALGTRIVRHWRNKVLAPAMETWHEHAHAQARARGILTRIAARWVLRDISVAYFTWKLAASKERRAKLISARIVSHWLHRAAAGTFDSWHVHAKEQRRIEDVCNKIVGLMLHQQV
jgi:hypothetical protein